MAGRSFSPMTSSFNPGRTSSLRGSKSSPPLRRTSSIAMALFGVSAMRRWTDEISLGFFRFRGFWWCFFKAQKKIEIWSETVSGSGAEQPYFFLVGEEDSWVSKKLSQRWWVVFLWTGFCMVVVEILGGGLKKHRFLGREVCVRKHATNFFLWGGRNYCKVDDFTHFLDFSTPKMGGHHPNVRIPRPPWPRWIICCDSKSGWCSWPTTPTRREHNSCNRSSLSICLCDRVEKKTHDFLIYRGWESQPTPFRRGLYIPII